ncbi:alpha/beta-hydrolase [Clavulina sp. PMI_390]|nr:alpha/beta-hydrolase [Clavulina sp. PMI_390]
MPQALFEPTVTGTLKRVDIPRTGSWHTALFWGFLYLRRFYFRALNNISSIFRMLDPRRLIGLAPGLPPFRKVLPRGPQIWKFPPDSRYVNGFIESGQERVAGQWENKESGWVLTTLSPQTDLSAVRRSILYFHGSGFQSPISEAHWGFCGYLSRWLDAEVVVAPYPLGINNPGPEWRSALLSVYKEFVSRAGGKEIIVAGDSAGGMISLGLVYELHAANLPLPHQIVAICPPTDLALAARSAMLTIEPYDPFLAVDYAHVALRVYAGVSVPASVAHAGKAYTITMPVEMATNPAYSPQAGNPAFLREAGTKVIVVNGEWDILYPDAEHYVEMLAKAGVDVTYIVGEKQFHIFPVMVGSVKESKMAANMIVQAILRNEEDSHQKNGKSAI